MKSIIIYATKCGSTEKAAKMLKKNMKGEVDLINIMKENVPDIKCYDNIILGASVYAGNIQKKLVNYINENLDIILKKRIGLFICAAQSDEKEIEKYLRELFNPELYNNALCADTFGYEIHFEKLNFIERFIIKRVKKTRDNVYELKDESIKKFGEKMC
ncbi:flavodoxin domain-containing protein [Haloimpatiens sp. FM7330]|uniref:flavodoxin domain-containing protein n=1 Tax=Haloimpatiens sp. FM7330 TaxID=3298610 RepID=UPI00363270E0